MQEKKNALIPYHMMCLLFGLLALFWPLDWILWITNFMYKEGLQKNKYLTCTFLHLFASPIDLFTSILNILCFSCPFLLKEELIMHHNNKLHPFPCLHCQPQTYIRMVQNLIERCLLLHMDKEQCVKALAEHARIRPLITLTVWRELLKENKDFFQSYFQTLPPRPFTNRYVQRAPRFARRNQGR